MKIIELKVVEFDKGTLDYKKELIGVLRAPIDPRAGADIEEMRRAIRVLDALEKVQGDTLELEDADFVFLQDRMRKARFGMIDPVIVEFLESIIDRK